MHFLVDNLVFPSLQPEGLESNPFLVALKEKSIAQSINPMTVGPIVPAFPTNTVSLPVPKGELPVPALDTFSIKVGNEIFATKKILAKGMTPQIILRKRANFYISPEGWADARLAEIQSLLTIDFLLLQKICWLVDQLID